MALSDPEVQRYIRYCDVEERVSLVPIHARTRGLMLRNLRTVLRKAGLEARFQQIYPEAYSAARWYPVGDYLERLAVAGALLAGPEKVHDGMRELGKRNALSFSESLVGKVTIRALSPKPLTLLRQGAAARRLTCDYGKWKLEHLEPGRAIMAMVDEFVWIDSNLAGAAEGTFEAIGKRVTVEVEMDSQFSGRHILSWD